MVDKKTVEYVANLARIKITEEEKNYLATQLSKIIEYIDKLKNLKVEGIEPMRGTHIHRNILREDKASPSIFKEDILSNSPQREKNYFKVPKVIE
ncbi:MAG: Asp-tRNA(Asn)/Glu-tRNA(Gln) amidotransferase subunit GatC [Candidatus Omnitrophica bacterium]|jgi:aspartyl-tRNA(Asn)/glutamyl-tRNA(Gln) amidotransferase subunit C|nr:Asp-tRNA(Asn)/Glu-tRNA(Gln) amidotransferase subunit GatC [Candidatus Omnitrophota bacterium]